MVRATLKATRDALEGIERLADGSAVLKARVCAAPADGEANDARVQPSDPARIARRLRRL